MVQVQQETVSRNYASNQQLGRSGEVKPEGTNFVTSLPIIAFQLVLMKCQKNDEWPIRIWLGRKGLKLSLFRGLPSLTIPFQWNLNLWKRLVENGSQLQKRGNSMWREIEKKARAEINFLIFSFLCSQSWAWESCEAKIWESETVD